jgi:hypothetical protein
MASELAASSTSPFALMAYLDKAYTEERHTYFYAALTPPVRMRLFGEAWK